MNSRIESLQPYPFERLDELLSGVKPNPAKTPIRWSIGEPKHDCPAFIKETLINHLNGLSNYPLTKGTDELRIAIARWLARRFSLPEKSIDHAHNVLPVSGTREALFSFTQAVVEPDSDALVLVPNPFYQIYEGATLLAGARPWFLNLDEQNGFLPDLDSVPAEIWSRCQLIFVCSPSNPTGACVPLSEWQKLLALSSQHGFVIASDECYSELFLDEDNPPIGLLEAACKFGNESFERCVVFHSLSKRSNVPGMRSGFVAGDRAILRKYLSYRTYHGCALPPPVQAASTIAWSDEEHVVENRKLYREKFKQVIETVGSLLPLKAPQASFYLWPELPMDDRLFAKQLYEEENLLLLPGSYLSREKDGINPGSRRARMALVAPLDECVEGAARLAQFIQKHVALEERR